MKPSITNGSSRSGAIAAAGIVLGLLACSSGTGSQKSGGSKGTDETGGSGDTGGAGDPTGGKGGAGTGGKAGTGGSSGGAGGSTGGAGGSTGGAGGSTGGAGGATGGAGGSTGGAGGSTGGAGGSTGGASGTGGRDAGIDAAAGRDSGADAAGGSTGGSGGGGTGGSAAMGVPPTSLACTTSGSRPALKKTEVASGLAKPTEIQGMPDENNVLWVIEHRNGNLRAVMNGQVVGTPVLHVNVAARGNEEEGFQSITLAPDFNTSKLFYIFYSAANPVSETTVDEYRKTGAASATFVRNVYRKSSSHQYHNGGSLAFNPMDRALYLSMGDNNVTCGPDCAQMPEGDYGRIMKINLDTKATVTAHYGLRNPYRFSFDPMTGDYYIGDVGESGGGVEKHFYIKAGTAKKNMGWGGGTRPPALDSGDSGTPAIGGFVYRGKAIPDLCGFYLYGQYNGGPIKALKVGPTGAVMVPPASTGINTAKLSSFGRDGQGELYFSEYTEGSVYRIDAN
jgi:hypothetical protein